MTKSTGRRPSLPPSSNEVLPLAPPGGMRDLLPPASSNRKLLSRRLMDAFALYGYDRVTTPPFEHADVLERGLATVDRRDLLRFVEPETGEVALLRPDITPQIARIIATRLSDRPAPYRLCYEGDVIRRRRGRARKQQQIAQSGVEYVGIAGTEADVEVIVLAARACEAVGLHEYRIELRDVGIGLLALEPIEESARPAIIGALAQKDGAGLDALLEGLTLDDATRARLVSLVGLYGDLSVLDRARESLDLAPMHASLDRLDDVARRLVEAGLGEKVVIDLGELSGQAYYTGVSFALLAAGPGEPVGMGGRYDNLLGHFGRELPATGFALNVDNLEWALKTAGSPFVAPLRLRAVVHGPVSAEADALASLALGLRNDGVGVARLVSGDTNDAGAFARAWGYDVVLWLDDDGVMATRITDREVRTFGQDSLIELEAWARASEK